MKKTIFLLLFLSMNFILSQNFEKKIEGKWKYNVMIDSIGFPMIDGIKTENLIFINEIEFDRNSSFKAKNKSKKLNGKWYILGNNLVLNFENKRSILYEIMRLNDLRLELKEEGMLIETLGFDRK